MFAAGKPHPLKEPAQRVILAIVKGKIDAVTDVEVLQEILLRYPQINEREKGLSVFDYFHRIMLDHILPIEDADVWNARELAEHYPTLDGRDLLHLGVMMRHNIKEIISTDSSFDIVGKIHRIDPRDY